jgi:hypothetical protein
MLKLIPFAEQEPPVSEPLIIPDVIVDAVEVRGGRHVVRFVGLATVPSIGREPEERRVTLRFTMALDVAREFWTDLAAALGEKGDDLEMRAAVAAAQFRDKRADN